MIIRLPEVVQKYLAAAGGYGKFVAIESLGIAPEQATRVFDFLDEDYNISRYFHFRDDSYSGPHPAYQINGFPQTHISIDPEIQSIL